MRRLILLIAILAVGIAGCGSTSSASTDPAAPTKTYKDKTYNFSFHYPASWKVPRKGKSELLQSGPVWVVPITIPGGAANMEVQVTENQPPLPAIKNGMTRPDPSGGPDVFKYFNTTLGGHHALRIERWSGTQKDQVDVAVQFSHVQLVLRLLTGNPPFTKKVLAGYRVIYKSMRLPFS